MPRISLVPVSWKRATLRIKAWLSHRPVLYALVGGTGVILFWRGIWLTMDYLMAAIRISPAAHDSIDIVNGLWWDGPLSAVLGALILMCTGAFISSLIGNEIIISGLKAEKSLTEKESRIIRSRSMEIEDIRHDIENSIEKLDELEREIESKPETKA